MCLSFHFSRGAAFGYTRRALEIKFASLDILQDLFGALTTRSGRPASRATWIP